MHFRKLNFKHPPHLANRRHRYHPSAPCLKNRQDRLIARLDLQSA